MQAYLPFLVVIAIVGAGIVTGLLFAFSNFVMRALADMPPEQGMHAMQRVNVRIINPIFVTFFFGTPIACAILVLATLGNLSSPGYPAILIGALAFLAGPFGITLTRNVPLNNKLADVQATEAAQHWPVYQQRWQFWNHIRSYIGIGAIALLAYGATILGA